jgi:hypothetical protein
LLVLDCVTSDRQLTAGQSWNLLDMANQLALSELNAALLDLERAVSYIEIVLSPPPSKTPQHLVLREAIPHLQKAVDAVAECCESADLGLSPPTRAALKRVQSLLSGDERAQWQLHSNFSLIGEISRAFRNALLADLKSHRFQYISGADSQLLEADREHFGQKVAMKFPMATDDINAAARCLALAEGTACVFHLMRALEHGLHQLARVMNVSMLPTIDLENWKNIIDQIEKEIQNERKALTQQPKSHAKDERLQLLAEIATQFGYFKDAWRNHVAHVKKSYDPDQARSTWNHVREFMRKMADVV